MWVLIDLHGFISVPRKTVVDRISEHRVVIPLTALFIVIFFLGIPYNGSIEIEFDKSHYVVGDIVNASIYLSNVHPWPIRVQAYNELEITREVNGEPSGIVDGAFITWSGESSIYIPPNSRKIVHQGYSFRVGEAGECTVVVELYTADTLTCRGSNSIIVNAGLSPIRREMVDEILRIALIEEKIPDSHMLLGRQPIILSSESIGNYTQQIDGIEIRVMTPEEIQREADASGDFLYLRFKRLTFPSDSSAVVELDNIWATGCGSTNMYLSGGGFTMTLNKESDGTWTHNISVMWIS